MKDIFISGFCVRTYGNRIAICDTSTHKQLFLDEKDSEKFVELISCNAKELAVLLEEQEYRTIYSEMKNYNIIKPKMEVLSPNQKVNVELHEYTVSNNILFSVCIELTTECNERCLHCYVDKNTAQQRYEPLSTDELKCLLKQLRQIGVMEVVFTGGEPFVRKDIWDILETAKNLAFSVTIYSNAQAILDEDIFRLKELNVDHFHASLYHSTAQKHDYITKVKGSFDKTVDVLKKLNLIGIDTNIKFLAMRGAENDLPNMLSLAKKLGSSLQLSIAVFPTSNGDYTPCDYEIDSIDDITNIYKQWITGDIMRNIDASKNIESKICNAGCNSLSITSYGEVYPCNVFQLNLGNIRNNNISDIWNNSLELSQWRKAKFKDIEGCKECSFVKYCSFCPGQSFIRNGNPYQRYDGACMRAKALSLVNE